MGRRALIVGAFALVAVAGAFAATTVTEYHVWTNVVTLQGQGKKSVVTYRGTITDVDTVPDPVTVTVTATEPPATTAPPPTTTAPPPTTTEPPPAGTIQVAPGGDLAAAYTQAQDGWVIQLAAGNYGVWWTASGAKRVTVQGVPGTVFRQLYSSLSNVTFDGLDIDAGRAKTAGGAAFESHGDNATFRNGRIGNVTDEKGALISGSNFTFDNVVFHDVRLATPGVHNECVYAIGVPFFTMRNSTFRNCVTMDLFFTYGSWWSPMPPTYGNVTLENNWFGRSVYPDEVTTHAAGLWIGWVGVGGQPGTLFGWKIRNNFFENDVFSDQPFDSASIVCGNTGDAPAGWTVPC